ncbi:MAG: tautomerase family protein [Alkalinema sp. RU_4_3]|nr:tautomerase family protein [Alkalinema sp. RU_4_3]
MPQTKIYGNAAFINAVRSQFSDLLHSCMVDALNYPVEKRFHRFFPMETENFIYPGDRSHRYTVIEISLFEGRSVEAKKGLIRLIYHRLGEGLGLDGDDIEITLTETPRCNWGVRGVPGDELVVNYKVDL